MDLRTLEGVKQLLDMEIFDIKDALDDLNHIEDKGRGDRACCVLDEVIREVTRAREALIKLLGGEDD